LVEVDFVRIGARVFAVVRVPAVDLERLGPLATGGGVRLADADAAVAG
jgi:hypothetical protein